VVYDSEPGFAAFLVAVLYLCRRLDLLHTQQIVPHFERDLQRGHILIHRTIQDIRHCVQYYSIHSFADCRINYCRKNPVPNAVRGYSPPIVILSGACRRHAQPKDLAYEYNCRYNIPMIKYYVYILSNKSGTLYIGVTGNITKRLYEHKNKLIPAFTHKYNIDRLLYVETYTNPDSAIAREKQLKKWRRQKKLNLIKSRNPDLKDLSIQWFT